MSSSRLNRENYQIPLEEIKSATENFSPQRCIGGGGFGEVYKGKLWKRGRNRTVAIKRLGKDSHQGEHEFRNELEMIRRFDHENIISFIGYCDEDSEMIIVYEYAENRSLDHHLGDPNKIRHITWMQRLNICIGAAKGLNYLHSGLGEHNRVIHRDVKSANILLDNNFVAKICDFGLSKSGPRNQPDTKLYTKVAGTKFYLDPTYHESRILQKESDVYSFGVVLFEVLSGMLVYNGRSIGDQQQFLMTLVRGYHDNEPHKLIDPYIRDQIDSRSFDTYKEIAYQCISYDLMERPTMDDVINRIEEALTIQMAEHSSVSTPAYNSMTESLLHKLNSVNPYDLWIASSEISRLTKTNHENRVAFAKAEAISLLTNLLTSMDSWIQENAVTSLFNLSVYEKNKAIMVSFGAVRGIVYVLSNGSMVARENAAATLFSLSVNYNKDVIIGSAGAVSPLVLLLSEGSERGKRMATNALFTLCIHEDNKIRALKAGVVPLLMELLTEPHGVLKEKAIAILAVLSIHVEGRLAIGKVEVVPILVKLIGCGSPRNKENAALVLVELCLGDQKYLAEAQELGVMDKMMYLLEHGTDRRKRKAKQLLQKIKDQRHGHFQSDTK
ncbi:probable serine/threonine-protein kinase PBL2 [Lactuca sativa]|nr:probable serine/threonine-protein kinase PBL2 [Lactuca sativa]